MMTGVKKKQVLLVEDDQAHRRLVQRALGTSDRYELRLVGSLQEANTFIKEGSPDLVMADLHLPDGRGTELLAKEGGHPSFPLIILTSQGDQQMAVEAMKGGALDYIVKSEQMFLHLNEIFDRALGEWAHICALHQTQQMLRQSQVELLQKHEAQTRLFQQMEAARQEWEFTIDCIEDLIILTDREGKILRTNRAMVALTGLSPKELYHQNVFEFFADCELGFSNERMQTSKFHHLPSGRWYILQVQFFKEENAFAGAVISGHDCTDQKILFEKLTKSNHDLGQQRKTLRTVYQELKDTQLAIIQKEKMASIGLMAAGMVHEINNPIGYVQSNLQSLQTSLKSLLNYVGELETVAAEHAPRFKDELKKRLDIEHVSSDIQATISESLAGTNRVRQIIKDLKMFSRTEEREYVPSDVNRLLESSLNLIPNDLKLKAAIRRQYCRIPPVSCAPPRLSQVFLNLLMNAFQAIDVKGEIRLKTWVDGPSAFVRVEDDGRGIPSENLQRIFDPFFTTNRAGVGTGLGLSIAYEIVCEHGGDIWGDSEDGCGAIFTIRLPLKREV
jgi:two-component system NtrC family sensor kinase